MREHLRRIISFAIIGGPVFLLSIVDMQLFVRVFGVNPVVAFPFSTAINITLNYMLCRRFTWSDVEINWWKGAWRFGVSRSGSSAFEYGAFSFLIGLGSTTLSAQLISATMIGLINYLTTHMWVFSA